MVLSDCPFARVLDLALRGRFSDCVGEAPGSPPSCVQGITADPRAPRDVDVPLRENITCNGEAFRILLGLSEELMARLPDLPPEEAEEVFRIAKTRMDRSVSLPSPPS